MGDFKPAGIATVSPFIMTTRPEAVVEFAVAGLGARLLESPLRHRDGAFWHAALAIADGTVMVNGIADPAMERLAFVHLYVPDCDAAFGRAIAAGAREMMAPADQFYGERAGGVVDVAGNVWWLATLAETLDRDELERRAHAADAAREGR